MALSKASELTRTNGSTIPLFPLLSLAIYNGNSNNHREPVLPEYTDQAVQITLEYPEVATMGFWMANDDTSPVGDIPAFFDQVSLIPIPDCECP